MSHEAGLSDFESPISNLEEQEYSALEGRFFWWINRFRNESVVFDISYGDREFTVEARVFCEGEWFGAWELLAASGVYEPLGASGESFVLNKDFMRRTILALAEGVKEHWGTLCSCDKRLIEKTLQQRSERLSQSMLEQEMEGVRRAGIRASEAFHSANYQAAIRHLQPYV